ncbi:MAG: hypothetical protein Q7V31_12160 [Parvibaculum sp.]|uniref:hypothetical protein n=1 Tax=Parvibaculum sp. TaxID=2024848 RepID=UPI00271BD3B7|nr:hypothetical protein [Parvibaculum sp.]MDO8839671.1 hypothetical protein [Parvibaculum sp.]
MNRDLLLSTPTRTAASRTMQVIDGVQDYQPHEQIVALAATFLLLCERWNTDPRDALRITDRIINHAEGKRPEFAAVRDYMEGEL